jgi:hypothetical protein
MFEQHGQLDFENTVRNMLNLGAGSVRLELVIRALPQTYCNKSINRIRHCLCGLY